MVSEEAVEYEATANNVDDEMRDFDTDPVADEPLVTDIGDLLGQHRATFNDARTHRYTLCWDWTSPDEGDEEIYAARLAVWLMLNPSTADAFTLDPTLRRCMDFSQRLGFHGMRILNLFAYRATNPKRLMDDDIDPVGLSNDETILAARELLPGATWIAGWGVNGGLHGRDRHVMRLLDQRGVQLHALAITKYGHPQHPLYVPGNAELMTYPRTETS